MSRIPTLTPKQDARILRAYRAMDRHGSVKALTERFECSESTIRAAIARALAAEAAALAAA